MSDVLEISGNCPSCKRDTKFREFTLSENLVSLGGFVSGFLFGGLSGKVENSSAVLDAVGEERRFPNYKCGVCTAEVMQCSACAEIIPYSHSAKSHVCGAKNIEQRNGKIARNIDDSVAIIERLGSLRQKGLITESEFDQQKKKILESI